MGRVITFPGEEKLPPGPVRSFAEELYALWRRADRLSPRKLAAELAGRHDLNGTASRETIRKALIGETVPMQWATVEALLIVLCERLGLDPNIHDDWAGPTLKSKLKELWADAIEHTATEHAPAQPFMDDPWAATDATEIEQESAGAGWPSAAASVEPMSLAEAEAEAAREDAEQDAAVNGSPIATRSGHLTGWPSLKASQGWGQGTSSGPYPDEPPF